MKHLVFDNPEFNEGPNLTVRFGTKWDAYHGHEVLLIDTEGNSYGTAHISTEVRNFSDLTDQDLEDEHDPDCRTVEGLATALSGIYDQFTTESYVTLVSFLY